MKSNRKAQNHKVLLMKELVKFMECIDKRFLNGCIPEVNSESRRG
jgi:hypothetical protein